MNRKKEGSATCYSFAVYKGLRDTDRIFVFLRTVPYLISTITQLKC
jgi:hypothetical protein